MAKQINWKDHFYVVDVDHGIEEYPTATKSRFAASKLAMKVCKEEGLHPIANNLLHTYVLADESGNVVRIIGNIVAQVAE